MTLIVKVALRREEISRFKRIMREARHVTEDLSRDEVIRGARHLVRRLRDEATPGFVLDRISVVEQLIDMAADPHWRRSPEADRRILDALVGYCEPVRFLRGSPRGPSYLDDAVVIELMRHEFRDEMRTYQARHDSGRRGVGASRAPSGCWGWLRRKARFGYRRRK